MGEPVGAAPLSQVHGDHRLQCVGEQSCPSRQASENPDTWGTWAPLRSPRSDIRGLPVLGAGPPYLYVAGTLDGVCSLPWLRPSAPHPRPQRLSPGVLWLQSLGAGRALLFLHQFLGSC